MNFCSRMCYGASLILVVCMASEWRQRVSPEEQQQPTATDRTTMEQKLLSDIIETEMTRSYYRYMDGKYTKVHGKTAFTITTIAATTGNIKDIEVFIVNLTSPFNGQDILKATIHLKGHRRQQEFQTIFEQRLLLTLYDLDKLEQGRKLLTSSLERTSRMGASADVTKSLRPVIVTGYRILAAVVTVNGSGESYNRMIMNGLLRSAYLPYLTVYSSADGDFYRDHVSRKSARPESLYETIVNPETGRKEFLYTFKHSRHQEGLRNRHKRDVDERPSVSNKETISPNEAVESASSSSGVRDVLIHRINRDKELSISYKETKLPYKSFVSLNSLRRKLNIKRHFGRSKSWLKKVYGHRLFQGRSTSKGLGSILLSRLMGIERDFNLTGLTNVTLERVSKRLSRHLTSLGMFLTSANLLIGDTQGQSCRLQRHNVDVIDAGLEEQIVLPRTIELNYCQGYCVMPDKKLKTKYSNYAALHDLVKAVGIQRLRTPCCVQNNLNPLVLLYRESVQTYTLKLYKDMVVNSCACQ